MRAFCTLCSHLEIGHYFLAVYFSPLVSGSHLYCVLESPDEYKSWILWEMTSRMFPYSVFTWFDSGYMFGVSFTGDDTSRAVFLVCLRAQDARHFGRHGPEGHLRRPRQGLRSRSPWFGARVHCRMWFHGPESANCLEVSQLQLI